MTCPDTSRGLNHGLAVVVATVTLDLLPRLTFMGGQIRFVRIADLAVEDIDNVVVLLQPNVKIERFPLGIPFGRGNWGHISIFYN